MLRPVSENFLRKLVRQNTSLHQVKRPYLPGIGENNSTSSQIWSLGKLAR